MAKFVRTSFMDGPQSKYNLESLNEAKELVESVATTASALQVKQKEYQKKLSTDGYIRHQVNKAVDESLC